MNIGLLGFGVVGGGVWELAQENRALNVKKVLVRRGGAAAGQGGGAGRGGHPPGHRYRHGGGGAGRSAPGL